MKTAYASQLEQTLFDLERKLMDPALRRDTAQIAHLLSDDFTEYGSSGRIYRKTEILEVLRRELPISVQAENFALSRFASDVALVTYTTRKRVDGQQYVRALRSSIWIRRGGKWQIVFHQGTISEAIP